MLESEVSKQITTPLTAPVFPKGPYKFFNREYLNIVYRTDLEALKKVVPEPLDLDGEFVRFEMMAMPDATGLGSYTECGQAIPVKFNGVKGDYLHMMYLDNESAIAVGRESSAYPKKLGTPRLFVDADTLVGTLKYGTLPVATATMGYKYEELDIKKAYNQISRPNFMVKIIQGYDGKPRICELVCSENKNITIHGAWTGCARLQLFSHALAPLADLPVLEIISASHIITDLTLGTPHVVHDYLSKN